jgi:hypothetical protein
LRTVGSKLKRRVAKTFPIKLSAKFECSANFTVNSNMGPGTSCHCSSAHSPRTSPRKGNELLGGDLTIVGFDKSRQKRLDGLARGAAIAGERLDRG